MAVVVAAAVAAVRVLVFVQQVAAVLVDTPVTAEVVGHLGGLVPQGRAAAEVAVEVPNRAAVAAVSVFTVKEATAHPMAEEAQGVLHLLAQ
jgi:hypothetical protein